MELIRDTLGSLLEGWAERSGDKTFISYPDRGLTLSYSEFNDRVDRVARGLMSLGVGEGCKVGIWAKNIPDWLTIFFAAAKLRAISVTINTNYKSSELEYILQNADIHTLCMMNGYRDSDYISMIYDSVPELTKGERGALNSKRFPALRNVVYLGQEKLRGIYNTSEIISIGTYCDNAKYEALKSKVECDDVVNIQYTSGTTGFPKGVMLTHYNILNNGKATAEFMRYTADDKLLVCVPLFHCFGCVLALCAVLTNGATMVLVEDFDPLRVLAAIHKERCTILYGVPTMFIAELNHPLFDMFDLTSLRTGIMAGAVCPIETMNAVMERMHCQLISIYGLTETSPGMTGSDLSDPTEVRATTVGRAFPEIEVRIIDPETGEECPVGVSGEVCCRGWNVMKGYYKNPEATAETIDKDGFLHSGDLGMVDENGLYHITGRIKDMIIRGGENIYPREVENFLFQLPQIKGVEVVGLPSERYGEEVAAFVTLKDGEIVTEEDIQLFCRGKIARYKIPKYIHFVEAFPMTASGKIQKYKLREMGIELLAKNS